MPLFGDSESIPILLGINAGVTVVIQLSFFCVAYAFKFDKVTDFAGSMNFLVIALLGLFLQRTFYIRQCILTGFVVVWSLRLGIFLLIRVLKREKDARFDDIRESFIRFLVFWIFQMLWVWTVSLPVTMVNGANLDAPLNPLDYVGWSLWAIGFVIETIADHQKFQFVQQRSTIAPDQPKKGYQSAGGVWDVSRHPNYFGEILLWIGVFLSSCSIYEANNFPGGYASVLSPLFTFVFLMFVSGMPSAENSANKRYADQPEYIKYKTSTSPLILLPTCCYAALPKIIKIIFCCDYPLYWKHLGSRAELLDNVQTERA